VLAAAAARTERIRLTSGVTVLPVLDPVRVYEDFAQLGLINDGRAEITVGRSAFVEPFALFGHSLEDYDALFAEKLAYCSRCASKRASTGPATSGRHCETPRSPRARFRRPCRCGSASAARRGAPHVPANWACP
jgi:alkanesulfonate monooxygenase SsuD/methylene tetrahydromethanopterin reductase-like flavin-dependent oxidoreductase (luciferase family)